MEVAVTSAGKSPVSKNILLWLVAIGFFMET